MKYEGQRETFKFIGDSAGNKAKRIVKGEPTETYTQTDIIAAFNDNKGLICGGSKLNTGKDSPSIAYMIYFGKEKSNPEQIIKIIINKSMIEKGDINTLAIDSLCQYSLRVNKKNNKKLILGTIAGTLGGLVLAGSMLGGLVWADKKESEIQNKKAEDHQEWLTEQRIGNGTYKSWLEEQGLIDEESVNEVINSELTSGRSY